MNRLEGSDALPLSGDREVLRMPVGVAWAHEVPGVRLWLLYTFDAGGVELCEIRDVKPVPVE
jgi:hypothetical protein